ncbi:MAG: insulinase family protein [Polyangiaceae bacterium]|nr:insulinase family protein [Polyangiaceae bacterium]
MGGDIRERSGEHPFRVTTLDHGLRVVVAAQPALHRAHVALYVRVGSRFESRKTNGLSHFLEHMLYRGTPQLKSAHEVNLAVESLGGCLYAATQVDSGIFSVTVPPELVTEASALFGEIITCPIFADIEIEKDIVCEEILEDLDDDGRQVDADNLSRQLIYPVHPLGFTITGDAERVLSFDQAMLRAHHAQHYATTSSVLAFSGAIDPDEAVALASRYFVDLPRGKAIETLAPIHTQTKPRISIVENVSSQTELRVCFRAVSERSTYRPAMDMLMRLLDDGMSTRLYHRIVDAKGLCYDVGASFDGYEDDGVLDFSAGVQHARSSIVTREILEILLEIARHGPTGSELDKAQRRHAWELQAMLDSPEDLASFYAGGLLVDRFETPEARMAANLRVTPQEIQSLAQMLAQPDRLNVVAVGLFDNGEDERLEEVVCNFRGA